MRSKDDDRDLHPIEMLMGMELEGKMEASGFKSSETVTDPETGEESLVVYAKPKENKEEG